MLRFIIITITSMLLAFTQPALADSTFTQRADVQSFINMMVKKHNFNRQQLTQLLNQVKYHEIVIKHVNKPLESNPWRTYQRMFVTQSRIDSGVKFWHKHAAALQKAEEIYGVPPSIIVATLGVETKYGERIGDYRVIDSLTSLGFSNIKRAPFFRGQLEDFLLLTREQNLDPFKVIGSYAGAIGMPQFIPSSYRSYAASFSKKQSIDLINNTDDVIASIANYYNKNGWAKHEPVAVPATINSSKYSHLLNTGSKPVITVKMLSEYGITPARPISDKDAKIKMIELTSDKNKEYWVGFHNFDVIKRYNSNDLYAMAVYQLSHSIQSRKERS